MDPMDRTDGRRIGCIIQARLDSTRLCHKVLREIPPKSGKTVLYHCLAATQGARRIDTVWVTTPDLALWELATGYMEGNDGWVIWSQHWRGPRDPLAEYYHAAKKARLDIVVRLTADCPMITSAIIDAAVAEFLASGADYGYNGKDGADVEVFTAAALAEAYEKAGPDEHEHVTTWIRRHCRCVDLTPPAGEFLSLNTPAEYERICALMNSPLPSPPDGG